MENQLRLVVHSKKIVYDDLIVSPLFIDKYVKKEKLNDESTNETVRNGSKARFYAPKYLNDRQINSYAVSAYVDTLKRSNFYCQSAIVPLLKLVSSAAPHDEIPVIFIKLRLPDKQFLDYRWAERTSRMAMEKAEISHAMSWLSTLGGAFSALGEQFQHCAQMAGKISVHQFTLALKLGDPLLIARCKLYAALSMIQQGNLKIPRIIIQSIFKFALEQKDVLLARMCQGVWSKLRYCYKLRREQKKKLGK
ncbi:uncharacterized protein F58A4.6 [Venturia canescens]|uniref:uncharacterized protein F58A4.6 n=1 Tax=Venturia canescens TaxID=32260 RepID=UPI001C9D2D68|nr:uncharacterized protein F58A4.6 [Venturia canescens]